MKHIRINKFPFNDATELMLTDCGKDFYSAANLPGIFVRETSNRQVYKDGEIKGEMDFSCIVDPDNKMIHERMVVNIEHQSTPVDEKKLEQMGRYAIQQIHDENLPQLTVVISHIETEKHLQGYYITPSHHIEPSYIEFSEEDIEKRLNRVKTIINNNEPLTNEDALNLGIIAVLAPRHKALEIIEEVVELYIQISQQLPRRMELVLYEAISQMIDAYSQEEEEYQRLKNMLDVNTSEETKEESKFIKSLEEKNKFYHDKVITLEKNYGTLKEDYDTAIERIKVLENELNLRNDFKNSK